MIYFYVIKKRGESGERCINGPYGHTYMWKEKSRMKYYKKPFKYHRKDNCGKLPYKREHMHGIVRWKVEGQVADFMEDMVSDGTCQKIGYHNRA